MSRPKRSKGVFLPLTYGGFIGSKKVSPPDWLQRRGPTITVKIGLHDRLQEKRREAGTPIPDPVVGEAIIDTGATVTTIDTSVAQELGLRETGPVQAVGIGGASAGFTTACSVDIHGLIGNLARAHCHDLAKHSTGLLALIGRDVLRHFVLHYNGPKGRITLELPSPETAVAGPAKKRKDRGKRPPGKRRKRT